MAKPNSYEETPFSRCVLEMSTVGDKIEKLEGMNGGLAHQVEDCRRDLVKLDERIAKLERNAGLPETCEKSLGAFKPFRCIENAFAIFIGIFCFFFTK